MRKGRLLWAASAVVPLAVFGPGFSPFADAASTASNPPGALSAAAASRLAQNANQPVLVILKNQHPEAPASPAGAAHRSQVVAGDQSGIVNELHQVRATGLKTYRTINAVAATVSFGEKQRLAADPAVASVIPDAPISLANPAVAATRAAVAAGGSTTPAPGVCAANGGVQLNPEALQTTHTASDDRKALTAQSLGYTGKGVTVAFIADGLDTNNPDFIRADGSKVFVDYKDFTGEGTAAPTTAGEAFLDASSIGAQGRQVYDVSHYSALPLSQPCKIRVLGVSPGASLVGLKVFGVNDAAVTSDFLQAIDYAVSVDHVDVINESFGANPFPDTSQDAIRIFDEQAVAAGTTVVVSSGDSGVTNTIGSPGTDPAVISVGASTTYRIDEQTGYAAARFSNGHWIDNNISSLSSGGFTQDGRTVDLVAPGELNWALCTADTTMYLECSNYAGQPSNVQASGGTSESAPLTAGGAALVIQAFREGHGGASPTPAVVKQILTSTADDIFAPAEQQGAGELDTYRAVRAARSYPGGVSPAAAAPTAASTVLTSASQLDASGLPAVQNQLTETVTNGGATPETVGVSSRTLGAYSSLASSTVTLSDTTSPHTTDFQGHTVNYQKVHFTVPAGTDRLSANITYQGASTALSARVRLTLIDPTGALAGYSLPQGIGNFGNSQVAHPVAGQWTAIISSRQLATGGTNGQVIFGASGAKYRSWGTVSPSTLHLAPGASADVTLTVRDPQNPGDRSGSILLSTTGSSAAAAAVTTVPVAIRSLIPTGSGPTTFPGTLTGGNGRASQTGQTAYYQLDVYGSSALNASVLLADNANNPYYAQLVDPSGQAVAVATNELPGFTAAGITATPELGAQLHVLNPVSGRWSLLIDFFGQVSGTQLAQRYSVTVDQTPVAAHARGLPVSASTHLKAGKAITAYVSVTNTGPSPESYFLDGRLNATTDLQLTPLTTNSVTLPLTVTSTSPEYLVPTNSTAVGVAAESTVPIMFDFGAFAGFGDPDLPSSTVGTLATGGLSENPLVQGTWFVNPSELGPYPTTGAPAAPAQTAMAVSTQAFDPAVTASTGDLWLESTNPSAAINPQVIQPGQTATIPVTITPSGPKGSVVSGILYLDDAQLISEVGLTPDGNQEAAIPYSYTIK